MTAQHSTRYDLELAFSPTLDRQNLVDDIARLEAETRVLENIDQLEHSAAAVHANERALRSEERPNECPHHAVASLTLQNFVHPLPLLRINGGASSNERQGWRRYIFDDVGCFRWQLFVLLGVVLLGGIIGGLFAQFNNKPHVDCVRCAGNQGDGVHHETESGELSMEKSKDNQKTPLTNGEGANPFKDSKNTVIVVVLLVLGCAFLCFWLNVSRFCPPMSPSEMFEDIAVDPAGGTGDGETDGGTDGQDGPREAAPVSSAGLISSIAPESSLSSLYISHSPQTRVLPDMEPREG